MNHDLPAAFLFSVRITDNPADEGDVFQAVSGLDTERDVAKLVEGGENRFVHALPGRALSQNLILERGVVSLDSPLFAWCKTTFELGMSEPITPRSLTVELLDHDNTPVIAWSVSGAWPVRWELGELESDDRDTAIETLELANSSISRHRVGGLQSE